MKSSWLDNSTELAPGASRRTPPLCVNMPKLINKELNGIYPFLSIKGNVTHGDGRKNDNQFIMYNTLSPEVRFMTIVS